MLAKDLDKKVEARIDDVARKADQDGVLADELFVSEKVIQALNGDVNFMGGYQPSRVMAMLPFSSSLLVNVCPACIEQENLSDFKKFVERGAIIPVLTSRYQDYSAEVVDFLAGRDHVSVYEFGFYKHVVLLSEGGRHVCTHCVEKNVEETLDFVRKKKNFDLYKRNVERIKNNLWPHVRPDFDLFNSVMEVCKKGDVRALAQLVEVSEGIHAVRNAQVFDAPILLRSDQFGDLPAGLIDADDEALAHYHCSV